MIEAAPQERIATLDVLRGVAVLGILAMNAPGFAMPEPAYFNPKAYGGDGPLDIAAWTINFIFFDGKMRGLFSVLFGASLLLITDAAEARGESAARVHYSRMLWLGVFGALHFFLVWWGDILLHYAILGLAAFALRKLDLTALGFVIVILIALDIAIMGSAGWSFVEVSRAAALPGAEAGAVEAWAQMSTEFAPLPPDAAARDFALYRGPWSQLVAHRWSEEASSPLWFLVFGGPETLALMAMGMLGYRTGFLTGACAPSLYLRIGIACSAIGAAGFAALAYAVVRSDFDIALVAAVALGGSIPFRLIMIVGYAALIVLLARRGGALPERLAAAGRAAFTNYLGTSLIMTGLLYGWGLGLYGQFGRAELWLLVLAMWALMLAWSKPWLERFRYGPFEWLWRSLARQKLQPMRRAS
jgi:uncharacterized protein